MVIHVVHRAQDSTPLGDDGHSSHRFGNGPLPISQPHVRNFGNGYDEAEAKEPFQRQIDYVTVRTTLLNQIV